LPAPMRAGLQPLSAAHANAAQPAASLRVSLIPRPAAGLGLAGAG